MDMNQRPFTKISKSKLNIVAFTKIFSLLSFIHLILPLPVAAQTSAWSGVCTHDGTPDGIPTIQGLQCLLANVLMVAVSLLGLVGFVMILYGGFRYLISGGNTSGTEKARNTITYAIIGLVLAISSFFIVNILSQFLGLPSLLNFIIPSSDTGIGGDWIGDFLN